MKNILFPTDFSEAAEKAFTYALHLADRMRARVITLHVYSRPQVKAKLPTTLEEFYSTFDLEDFENYKDSIPALRAMQNSQGFSHVEVLHRLERGDKVVPAILRVAGEEAADMIVMGTTGARGLKEIFLGSIAGEILENARCPVLAIPEKPEFDGEINRLAFTTTYKEEEKKALEKVIAITGPFHPEIFCINVDLAHTDPITHRMDRFSADFRERENIRFQVLDGNDIREVITTFLKKNRIDVLAMVTHKRNFLEELFNYSRTKMMSYHAETPILSIPADILE